MKTTSIEWLIEEIGKLNNGQPTEATIMYAKKLHRQELSKTWDESMRNLDARGGNIVRAWDDFDDWYWETYESNSNDYTEAQKNEERVSNAKIIKDAKEILYTKEQVMDAMDDACIKGFNNNLGLRFNHLYRKEYIDKYIKQLNK